MKARLKVPADITAEDAIATAKADPAVAAALEGKQLVKMCIRDRPEMVRAVIRREGLYRNTEGSSR